MANVEAKSLALIAQVAAAAKAASNWYTFGFSVGVAASVNGHKSKSNSNEVVSNPSNLSANNIKIQTPNDTTITGSNLSANNLIDINTNNLNINSSKNTYASESKDKSIGGTMRYTMYGGGGGSAGLNYSTSSSDTESLTNNNSHLYSAKDMNINTANDATIKGANLRADERLNLKVGNNLSLESVRDKYAYNERGYSVGVGIGFSSDKSPNSSFANPSSTKATSTNANFSRSSSNTITKQTVLSSITANELNVEVGKNTHLKGSLLAAGEYDKDNTFIDNHNLNLKTNTISYENLSNTSYAKGTNFSIGANYILEDKNNKDSKSNNNQEDKFTGLKSIDLSNHRNLSYSLSKNLATLGSGNIEIADKDNSDDLTRLNRDTTKLTKDLVNTSISSNVDASMDLRVVTKSGQKDIKDEFNTATAITKALNAIIETGEFNFNSEVKENVAQYEAGKLLGKELAQKLIDDSVTIEEKEALGNKFIQLFASMSGLDLDGISLRIIDDKFAKGKDDEKFLGHFNSGSIILNLAHIKNVDQFVSTLGHELKHAIDYKAGKFIPGDSKQDRYAKLKEDSFSDYLSKALNLQDSGINAKDAAINYIKNQSSLNTLLLNSYMFNGLDKSKGDNSPLLLAGVVIEKTIEIAPLIFGSWLIYNNASKDKDSSHEIFPSDEISTLPGTTFPKEEPNKNDNILTTPQTEQYDKITNGGVNTDNSFNEPYLGGIEGKEQNFKDNVIYADNDNKLLGNFEFTDKKHANKAIERGWNEKSIENAKQNPIKVGESINRNTGNKSTVYFVDDNQYIVIDNVTNTIVQTSDLNDKDWKVDSGIKNIRSTKWKQQILFLIY